jgi:hypothetical protein
MMQVEVMDSGRKSSRPAADIGTSHRVYGSEGAFGLWTAAQYSVVLEYLPASKSQINCPSYDSYSHLNRLIAALTPEHS